MADDKPLDLLTIRGYTSAALSWLACTPPDVEQAKTALLAFYNDLSAIERTHVIAEAPHLPCPHGRAHWSHCPHCLGINQTKPTLPADPYTTYDVARPEVDSYEKRPKGRHRKS